MIQIREAAERDTEKIISFNREMARETEGRELDPEKLAFGVSAVFRSPGKGFYLVAEIDGSVVGQLMVTTEWSDWRNGDFWWIQSVYVDPLFRRKGVYRRLHEAVVELARSREKVCGVRLYVDSSNAPALKTYSRLGMAKTGYIVMEHELGT